MNVDEHAYIGLNAGLLFSVINDSLCYFDKIKIDQTISAYSRNSLTGLSASERAYCMVI